MIIYTQRRGPDPDAYETRTRRIVRVNKPIGTVGTAVTSGWGHDVGHYIDVSASGTDRIDYTIRLTQADIDAINRLWNDSSEQRVKVDEELKR